ADEDDAIAAAPARREQPLLRADEADLHAAAAELAEELRLCAGVGDDEVRGAERGAVDGAERTRGERVGGEAAAGAHARVPERDERIQHERPALRRVPRRRDVEMARVPDKEDVEVVVRRSAQEPELGRPESCGGGEPGSVLVLAAVPDRDVMLDDLDACAA